MIKWSYRLLSVFGIEIRIHATFALALLIGALEFGTQFGARGAIFGVFLVSAIFVCVTLHELGHCFVARRFGAIVREIVLLPIGGIARLAREPSRPSEELLVAIAGPLVNLMIAVALFIGLGLDPLRLNEPSYWETIAALFDAPEPHALFGFLLLGNISLAVFNMFPAFPMDGGRVLRASLSFLLGRRQATAVATRVGQILAIGLTGCALLWIDSPMLAVIGLFVFFGASQERQMGRALEVLDGLTAGDVCDFHATHVSLDETVGDAIDHALRSGQSLFPVVHGSDLLGVLLRDEAVEVAARLGLGASVRVVLRRNLPVVDEKAPLTEVRSLVADSGLPVVVTSAGRFLGVLGGEDLSRILGLAARLSARGIRRPGALPLPVQVSASRAPPEVGG